MAVQLAVLILRKHSGHDYAIIFKKINFPKQITLIIMQVVYDLCILGNIQTPVEHDL